MRKSEPYRPTWDLRTIPDPAFASEVGRRRQSKRKTHGGGAPTIMQRCPLCTELMSSRELHRHYNRVNGEHRKERME